MTVDPTAIGAPAPTPRPAPAAAARQAAATAAEPKDPALWRAAKDFETAFMAEMLNYSGLAESDGAFSGGPGEQAFRSFLVREYASALTEQNALGLAESLYATLKQKAETHGA